MLIFFSFINGYFPSRRVLLNKSEPLEEFSTRIFGYEYVQSIKENQFIYSIVNPPYEKIVILLLDALRFDFILFDPEYEKKQKEKQITPSQGKNQEEIKYFLNNMPKIHEILKKEKRNSLLFRLDADPPTITTSRLKSILVGTFSSFLDINENFSPSSEVQDQLVEQLLINQTTITAIGDDTIKNLTDGISKEYLYHSFDIFDFFSVDNKCKAHFKDNYPLDDWGIMYIHMLGIDHVGHIEGPNSKVMQSMISSFDDFIDETIQIIQKDKRKGNTLLVVFGDHGQLESGDHGGSSEDEIESGMLIYSLLNMISLDKDIQEDNIILYVKQIPQAIRKNSNSNYTSMSSYKKYHSLLNGTNENTFEYNVKLTRQMNLLSTWALLKGFSIPFSNIGSIIMDIIPHAYIPQSKNLKETIKKEQEEEINEMEDPFPNQPKMFQEMLNFHYIAELNFANLWQMNRYFTTYSKKFKMLKNDTFYQINEIWKDIEQDKTKFFTPNRFHHFLNTTDLILQKEKKEYIEYINKMRNLMNIMQKYFYQIFIMEKHSFVILCLFLTVFLVIMLNCFYFYSKTDYYCKLRVGWWYFFLTIGFLCMIPFSRINKKMYLFLFPCLHVVMLVTGFLIRKEHKDWFYSFIYGILVFLLNSNYFKNEDVIEREIDLDKKEKTPEETKDSIKEEDIHETDNIKNERKCTSATSSKGNTSRIFYKIKTGSTKLSNFFINNKLFLFILFWTCHEGSQFYLMTKRWYIQCMYIIAIIITSIQSPKKYSIRIFIRLFVTLSIMCSIFALSLTNSYYLFNSEKYVLSECKLEVMLPLGCYLFHLGFLQWGINEKLQKSTKIQVLLFWTLQFVFTFLYLRKDNVYLTQIIPHATYILTILFLVFMITRKNSFIVTEQQGINKKEEETFDNKDENIQLKVKEVTNANISFENVRQVPVILSIVLFSLIQLLIIIYSTTNLSVLFLFFVSLLFSYFFLMTRTCTVEEEETVEEPPNENNTNNSNNNTNKNTQIHLNEKENILENQKKNNSSGTCENLIPSKFINEDKETLKKNLKNERNNVLRKFKMIEAKEVEQIQTYSVLKNISSYFINDTDFFILASILMKCSFFITGHIFLLNRLPLNAGYIGLSTYTWPISEFYIFNHIFLPFVFTILYIVYVQTTRSINQMRTWNKYDIFQFFLNPLWNLLFKCFALFTFHFAMSLWTSYYLKLHIKLTDLFIPNFLFLAVVNFMFVSVALLIILIVKRTIILKK